MKKICPYQNVTYIGWDEVKVENCPIEEHYTGESSICCYDKDYKNCPTYNLQKENEQLKEEKDSLYNALITTRTKYNNDKARYRRKAKRYKSILTELEEWLKEDRQICINQELDISKETDELILNKIQELKEKYK